MEFLARIIDWSLNQRVAVLVATLVLIVMGVAAALRLPIDAVPDVTNIQVQIVTSAPALSPLEVEQYVSIPVERSMQGIPSVTQVRSLSKYGMSVVTVVFEDGTDIYFARQHVNERMAEARASVPESYGEPRMGPVSTGLGEIYQFTLRNDDLSLMELDEILEWYIAPQLRTVPGVVEVNSMGGRNREYHVRLDPALVQAAGLSVSEIAAAIDSANANAGGGYLEQHREHFVIGSQGLITSRDDLLNVVLGATPQGAPITIASVGRVEFGARLRAGAASQDGEGEVVAGVVLMLMGGNPRTVAAAIDQKLAEISGGLPKGTRIDVFYDRRALVAKTTATAVRNLAEGALLVVGVLLLLLGDLRAGIIVAAVIPLSMLFALLLMDLFGMSGNLMSLGALDFGIIVDGAVIVVENASRRLDQAAERGEVLDDAARTHVVGKATSEVRGATIYGEAIIAVVYFPVLSLSGVEGKLFVPMATTVLFALAGAFVFSLTLVPVACSLFLRGRAHRSETILMRLAAAAYEPVLTLIRRRRYAVVAAGGVLVACALALFASLGAEFVPQLDEGDILLEARRFPGVALSESVEEDLRVQRAIRTIPEVETVVSKTGAPDLAIDPMGMGDTDVYIKLKDREQWREGLTKEALADELRETVEAAVPELSVSVSQPIEMRTNELVAGVRSDVGIIIYGPDLEVLVERGSKIAGIIQGIPGVVDVRVDQVEGLRYLRVIPDRRKLARYGLSVSDVNIAVEAMSVGHAAGVVLEGDRRFAIRVRMDHHPHADLNALSGQPLRTTRGDIVPLGDVAELRFVDGPAAVHREGLSRRIVVEFNVDGRDMNSVVQDAQAAVTAKLPDEKGYRIEWGGTFKHYHEARARLLLVIPVALGFIVFLLWSAFRATRPVALILLTLPPAMVGGVAALWLRAIPLSISAGVGFIALLGVAVLNGLVLVSVARARESAGDSPAIAVEEAARQRLRPILITALTDVLGFIPMALSTAPGAEVQRPLATVVIGGLTSATVLTLVLMPALYGLWRSSPRDPSTTSTPPAL